MDINYKYFIQFMLKKSYRSLTECVNFLKKLDSEQTSLTNFIKTINNEIKKQDLKIVRCKCELSENEFIILICTADDNINKLQNHYTQNELQFFDNVFQELVTEEDHRLNHIYCLNLSSTISRSSSDALLNKWLEDGYFVQINGFIHFGVKTIQEFRQVFYNDYKDYINICGLCNELIMSGFKCSLCKKMVHSFCLKRMKNVDKCLDCKAPWKELVSNADENI